ncbi:974_t:CDS:1, partial [Scutellospora calospora]
EFEQVIKNYTNIVEFNNNIFNNESKKTDADYVSNIENLDNLLQFNKEDLDIKKILDLNNFLDENIQEQINSNAELEPEDDELDYGIKEIINISM